MASTTLPAGLLDALRQAGRVVFLTGSGVSAESGVPTFRDALTGLWARFQPAELATPEAFQQDPQLVWDWYRERRRQVAAVAPNPAHHAIAALEARLPETLLVTQNVDGLHQRAGSVDAVEFHGNLFSNRCRACGHAAPQPDPELPAPPPCPDCGELMGPGVVWFGEAIPATAMERAWRGAGEADMLLAIGTSGLVTPAAALPEVARRGGALVVEINLHATPLSAEADFVVTGPAALSLPALVAAL